MSPKGWNRPSDGLKNDVATKAHSPRIGLIAGGAVVLAAGAFLCWLILPGPGDGEKLADGTYGRIKAADSAQRTKSKADVTRRTDGGKAGAAKAPAAASRGLSDVPAPDSLPKPPEKKVVFDNACDQLLAMATSGGNGNMPPLPVARGMEKDFLKALEKEIVINDDDSDQVKDLKRRVIEARMAMKELLAEGKTVNEILETHREQVNFSADVRRDAMMEARKILDSGDIEGAKQYVTMMNVALQQIGVQEIKMPLTKDEREARRQQRTLERQKKKEIKE